MRLIDSVAVAVQKYGDSIKIINGELVTLTRAFIEPLRYKNKIYIGGRKHTLGNYNNEKYLCIAKPSDKLVEDESVIECGDDKYIVKRCETYRVSDIPVYVWAILSRYNERMEDEYDAD